MSDYHHVASVIFINPEDKFILQRRDDKPGILNPGKVTAWGGAVEGNETPIEAAVREVAEETNLSPSQEDLEFFGEYPRNFKVKGQKVVCHVFILRNVDENSLIVREGQGFIIVDPKTNLSNPLYTEFTNDLIRDYRQL
jgi:8-oxo-dGTP pyrophosphatase MutT (NUDIX family)